MAISVDSPARNDAMRRRWDLPFPILSDPGGERFLQALDLWNAKERDGLAIPGVLVVSSQGDEISRVTSRDFADRLHDEAALATLEAQGLEPISPEPIALPADVEEETPKGAFTPAMYDFYFRGNYWGAVAIGRRLTDEASRQEVKAHREMSQGFIDAWKERRSAAS